MSGGAPQDSKLVADKAVRGLLLRSVRSGSGFRKSPLGVLIAFVMEGEEADGGQVIFMPSLAVKLEAAVFPVDFQAPPVLYYKGGEAEQADGALGFVLKGEAQAEGGGILLFKGPMPGDLPIFAAIGRQGLTLAGIQTVGAFSIEF